MPGGALLSRVLRRSTIGAGAFHFRVRDGIGWGRPAIATGQDNLTELVFLLVLYKHVFCFSVIIA